MTKHCCKVGRLLDKYELSPGMTEAEENELLVARWRGEAGYPETGLRPLVDWIHLAVLRDVYTDHGRSTIDPHLESDYESLTGDDENRRQMVLADLETDGIDGEELLDDFISAPTLYRHFTQCLGIQKEKPGGESNWERDKLEYIQSNVRDEVSDVLTSLENKHRLPNATDANVVVRVYLECPVCGKQVDVNRAEQRGYVCEEHMGRKDIQ